MADSYQKEIPKSRINLSVDLHTGGAQKKVELPLKLLIAGDFSAGKAIGTLSERKKIAINKNNFDSVLAEFDPSLKISAQNTLLGDGSSVPVSLNFRAMKDFEPESVARQIPALQSILAMRNLLKDLKSNVLDNATFRREFENILKDQTQSARLRGELALIATTSRNEAAK